MADRIRFHLDESVDPDVVRGLRQCGIDATATQASGLRTKTDEAQFAFARMEARVLVTHDPGFLSLATRNPRHPGIAFCGKAERTVGQVIRRLQLTYEVLRPEEMAGRVESL